MLNLVLAVSLSSLVSKRLTEQLIKSEKSGKVSKKKKKHRVIKDTVRGKNVDIANITLLYLCSDSFSRKQDLYNLI